MYGFIRDILFRFDAEQVHYFAMNRLKMLASSIAGKNWLTRHYAPKDKPVNAFGLTFKNPVGLGAGFDKNALYLNELQALGFGFVEIGTVTPLPQAGNDKPRLFRLPKDKAIINRMGFNNDGVEKISDRLKEWHAQNADANKRMIVGGNIGKNKLTPNELAWQDYEKCFLALKDVVDYFVVNVSSPNTPGLRALQEKDSLRKIFDVIGVHNNKLSMPKPVLLKIAPDLTLEQLDDVVSLALEINLSGLVISNTTVDRTFLKNSTTAEVDAIGAGGLSGKPLFGLSTEVLAYVHEKTKGKIPLIGSGGIYTADDANAKFRAGATLLQVWTGFIYEGPAILRNILNN